MQFLNIIGFEFKKSNSYNEKLNTQQRRDYQKVDFSGPAMPLMSTVMVHEFKNFIFCAAIAVEVT